MQDRVSLYPGRVKLVPIAGQENTYDMVRADSPTQEGTPLNKDTLLKDATAALYGLTNTAVPDDVLVLLNTLVSKLRESVDSMPTIESGSYTGTGTYGSSNPNTLTFNSKPLVIFIAGSGNLILVQGATTQYSLTSGGNDLKVSWDGNSVSWYNSSSAQSQMNFSGINAPTYYYYAICE